MSGHWLNSQRRERLPADWPQLRAAVRSRAQGKCEWHRVAARIAWPTPADRPCRMYGTQCDHIQRGDDHSLANLAWLCGAHHAAKSAWEGGTARWAGRTRPTEPHPGLR